MTFDEDKVRGIVRQIEAGWNAGDGHAYAAPFAEDADYVVVDGRHVKGRDVIAFGHQQIFDTVYRGSHNEAAVEGIRQLSDDIVAVHVKWHLRVPQGEHMQEGYAMNTMVLTRNAGGDWQVTLFQNTRIADQPHN